VERNLSPRGGRCGAEDDGNDCECGQIDAHGSRGKKEQASSRMERVLAPPTLGPGP
jgi:hypothetical protein